MCSAEVRLDVPWVCLSPYLLCYPSCGVCFHFHFFPGILSFDSLLARFGWLFFLRGIWFGLVWFLLACHSWEGTVVAVLMLFIKRISDLSLLPIYHARHGHPLSCSAQSAVCILQEKLGKGGINSCTQLDQRVPVKSAALHLVRSEETHNNCSCPIFLRVGHALGKKL